MLVLIYIHLDIKQIGIHTDILFDQTTVCCDGMPATHNSSLGDKTFAVAGPRVRNGIPQFVSDCSSPLTFKKYLKSYLFSLPGNTCY